MTVQSSPDSPQQKSKDKPDSWKDRTLRTLSPLSAAVGLAAGVQQFLDRVNTVAISVLIGALALALLTGGGYVYRNGLRRNLARRVPLGWTLLTGAAVVGLAIMATFLLVTRDGENPIPPPPGPTALPDPTGGVTPSPSSSTTPTRSPEPSPGGCTTLQTAAKIDRGPGATGSGPRLASASYTVSATDKPALRWDGQIFGRPAAGQVFYFVGTADPTTVDSTPDHNPGVENFLLVGQVKPDANGCWTAGPRSVYDCAGGITFIYHLLLVSEQQARSLDELKRTNASVRNDGIPHGNFRSLPITFLDSFNVPTKPGPGCSKG